MKTARIFNGIVVEILTPIEGFALSECFHPSILAASVSVPDEVMPGDAWPPVEPTPES